MKNLLGLMVLILMMGLDATAGIGGISGGDVPDPKSINGRLSGGKILFKKYSTSVSPIYSKSLCFDGDQFKARVSGCQLLTTQKERDNCQSSKGIEVTQPMVDTRTVCAKKEKGESCQEWVERPLIQSPTRLIQVLDNDGQEISEFEYRVPDCN